MDRSTRSWHSAVKEVRGQSWKRSADAFLVIPTCWQLLDGQCVHKGGTIIVATLTRLDRQGCGARPDAANGVNCEGGHRFTSQSVWHDFEDGWVLSSTRCVKGPRGDPPELVGWVRAADPSEGPALTRLSSGVRGQDKEATALIPGSRPTSACFLSADLSNLRLQTSSGSCTKRVGERCRASTLPRGESWDRPPNSVTPQGLFTEAEGCCPRKGALRGTQG